MQILLSCAKTMTEPGDCCAVGPRHTPMFQHDARMIAAEMCRYSTAEISAMLKVNPQIADSVRQRYDQFFDSSLSGAAICRYDGIVFKQFDVDAMTDSQLEYADYHINICSFVYGLLRPLDAINAYRLEGDIELPGLGFKSIFDFWKDRLTDPLIERCKADDGILVNLASDEMRKLFDWKRVTKELKVITPSFKVVTIGRPRNITVYTKICRGAMARYIIENRLTDPDALKDFSHIGFVYDSTTKNDPLYLLSYF